jgi:tetratricopeptide (TPR) repeat protein
MLLRAASLVLCFFLANSPLFSQKNNKDTRISEADVNKEKEFIEANRALLLGNYEKSATLFETVLKDTPKNHAALYGLARTYEVLNKNEKALETIRAAISLDKTNEWYQLIEADILEKTGSEKQAAKVYETLAKKYPFNDYYYHQQAYCLVKSKDAAKAIEVYNAIEKRFGVDEEVSQKKHELYISLRDFKNAALELQKLTTNFPDEIEFQYQLAGFYQQTSQPDLANATYKKILTRFPDDARARMAVLNTTKSTTTTEVNHNLQALIPIFKDAKVGLDLKIKQLIPFIPKISPQADATFLAEMLDLSRILETTHPNEAKVFALQADILYNSGKSAEALPVYKKAMSLNKTVFPIWEQYMQICIEMKDYKSLALTADQAIDYFPNQAKAHYFYGFSQLHSNNLPDAKVAIAQALLMKPNNPLFLGIYGAVLGKMKETDAAKLAFTKALATGGDQLPDVLEQYGDFLFQTNDVNNALIYWKKAQEKGGTTEALKKKIMDKGL